MPLNDATLLHHDMISLPPAFETFKVNYNSSDQKWDITTLVAKCAQEEERLRTQNPDFVNHIRQGGRRNNNNSRVSRSKKDKKGKKPYDGPKQDGSSSSKTFKCYHCGKEGHITKDCEEFKKWCVKKGNDDIISLVDESFYAYFSISTWWIDSGATVHVTNSPQGLSGMRTIRRGTRSLRVANGVEAEVEAIGTLQLEIHGGFTLRLLDVLYVPSIQRNLISISKLDRDGFSCTFGNNRCVIRCDGDLICYAPLHDELYLLSLSNISVMNVSDVNHKRKRSNESLQELYLLVAINKAYKSYNTR